MVDREQLAICKDRGHNMTVLDSMWLQCRSCGMWVKETRVIEEREDEPSAGERSLFMSLQGKDGGKPNA